ncbi:NAD(P)/FAD-dependent oxidoreductase [Hoeflea poritis]|uniref:FAD-dependent oxidoreductase n=1 Tax=Hoeflea poritis TaxID=2993659 RepID=A0ABT4VJS3_9HYPH|nr:FAD-dependent oxidoreductase [Hoeflea poritis]MDA4844968.1 FAD-dependent oxidoreductase [Hoeflea poritis]
MARPAMIIVGSGEAGGCAAVALREAGWEGPITLYGEERHGPYERPPLSKELLTEKEPPKPRPSAEAGRFDELGISHRPNSRVIDIDPAGKEISLHSGQTAHYEKLLLATGARARLMSVPGSEYALTLRSFEDAWALRHLFGAGGHAVIIGGGFIGLELAASAIKLGGRVTLLENQERLLSRAVPAELAQRLHEEHVCRGVRFHFGASVSRVERRAVILENGERIAGDVVICGIGAEPETALARKAGLRAQNGIVTDDRLCTSNPAIYACGDCAASVHPQFSDQPMRFESWQIAREQGALAGRNMAGANERQSIVPWFWSQQYDLHLQIAGLPDLGKSTVVRPLSDDAVLQFYIDGGGRLVGAAALGQLSDVARDMRIAQMLIARKATPDPAVLAATERRLKTLLAA